jgi:hypothetical protein
VAGWLPLFAPPNDNFNGGRTQLNFNFLQIGGDFPFVNHMKTGQGISKSGGGPPNPAILDANGYPTDGSGATTRCFGPSQTDRPGDWIIDWVGDLTTLYFPVTHTATGGAASGINGFYKFTPTGGDSTDLPGQIQFDIGITASNPSNRVTLMRLYHEDDSGIVDTQTFNTDFITALNDLKPGYLRFLDWFNANTNMTPHWDYRTPADAICYSGIYFSSRTVTSVSNTGDAFTCTLPGGASLTDKTLIHIVWSASSSNPTLLGKAVKTLYSETASVSSGDTWTLVFDADLDYWLGNREGLVSGVPPELMVELCNEIGAHFWMHIPGFAADNPANWATPFATYVKANLHPSLTAKYEVVNEIWNNREGFPFTSYFSAKGVVRWGASPGGDAYHNYYGYTLSINGEAISTVYSDDRSRYDVTCGVQSATFHSTSSSDARIQSTRYVAEGGGKTPASDWATAVSCTSYINSLMDVDPKNEVLALAIQWQTADEPTRQGLYEAYWEETSAEDTAPLPATTSLRVSYHEWKAWGAANGVNKLEPYEGGCSPDFPDPLSNDIGDISSVTKGASTTVVFSGGIIPLIGMWVYFPEVSPVTQLGGMLGEVTGQTGNTITVAINSSGFSGSSGAATGRAFCYMPLNITGITKAADGVITTDGTLGLVPNTGFYAFVTGVSGMTQINGVVARGTRTSNTAWTAETDTSGFSTYTSGGKLLVPTVSVRRDFNRGAITYSRVYDIEMANFDALADEGGEFGSLFYLGGTENCWSSIQPTRYGTKYPKYNAFKDYSA